MKRCTHCILPSNYPGLTLNEAGVCNYCDSYKAREYSEEDILKQEIFDFLKDNKDRNKDYDCMIGVSGGRDSSYLLWYITRKLNLKVIAYHSDNGFVPEIAKKNIETITNKLGVKLVAEKHFYLKKCFKHNIKTFLHAPSPAMIGMLCTGCRLGMDLGILKFAKKNNIPLLFHGTTPIEAGYYKIALLKSDFNNSNTLISLMLGYFREIKMNPRWLYNPTTLFITFMEFYHHFYRRNLYRKIKIFVPYYRFLKWDEKQINDTLRNELEWEHNSETNTSTWKTDCSIAPLKKYLYNKMLGFSDVDDHLSELIRTGQISREEALIRLPKDSSVPQEALSEICYRFGITQSELEKVGADI